MPYPKFDRNQLAVKHLTDRKNKACIERDHIPVTQLPGNLNDKKLFFIDTTVAKIQQARELKRPVILTFGAHTIKNGMAPTLIE